MARAHGNPAAVTADEGTRFLDALRRVVEGDGQQHVLPQHETLRERLARPRAPLEFCIDSLQPLDSRVLLAAQFKAGKTTLISNLIRSKVDGDPFLDCYRVRPMSGTLALLDFEMSERQLDTWYGDQHIRHDDRVLVFPLRGQTSSFDILAPTTRTAWARRLRECGVTYVVLDCLRPILDVLGLDEHREAGRFLVAFDALLREAGITEAAVVHHMGHTGERSRGDSRLRDWPDVEWKLMRQDEDPSSARFFAAYGRDVDVPECQLTFDAETRRLTVAGGSRKDAKTVEALADTSVSLTTTSAWAR